ncbi:putative transcription factor WD40-like family [Medicago truncatula]|uniref:Putative transcription factor WD40-like family n=1 Tax=Medicago truncatula TaxID=3880 RepID=G7JUE1_MEDTR|nr:WD repeat-containing protein 75 [Medicago truncatula]AES92286.2 transducin/WD-like repeat-protein [Medicago truncatula]RHN64725.1 putative transcription factor WD40-like family [Medicago truncatula]
MKGGQSYVSCSPSFSNSGDRLLVGSGTSVAIFSTTTALQVSSLDGHTDTVTSVIVVPGSNIVTYCWTSSLDGTIRHWDFSLLKCIKIIDLKLPIFSMVIPSLLSPEEEISEKKHFAYVCMQTGNEKDNRPKLCSAQIRKCNLTDFHKLSTITLKETKKPHPLIVSPCGKFLGIKEKRTLHIWKVPKVDSNSAVSKKISLHHTKTFSVLAFHPTERIVAAGDVTGRILIFRGFGAKNFQENDVLLNRTSMTDEECKPGVRQNDDAESCSTWHWHSDAVNLLSFSSDGVYLYSGGKEGVLVLWQLDTGKKKFLPRIGSPLRYFVDSLDPSFASISCADNQIHILKISSVEIMRSISGIKPPLSSQETCESISSQAAFDRSSGLVAVQTDNYGIQFYSLFANRGLYEVQVCERNYQPVDEVTVVVTMVELSTDGSMMGTVEVKLPEEGIGGLICLKFWDLDSDTKRFSMSTLVYEPHRDAHISAITFHPTCRMAVSTSYGGDFKIWVCREETQQKDQTHRNFSWMCHAVGSYKNKAMRAAAFSADGSVLAVAADTVITLWDHDKNELIAVVGETPSPIGRLIFVGNSEYLLSVSYGSTPQLSVWSMSKLAASWSYRIQIEAVSCALDLSYFAIIALIPKSKERLFKGDGIILVFNATDPIPVASWSVTKAKGGSIAFIKGKTSQTLLAYLNGDREYVLFDPYDKEAHELNMTMEDDLVGLEENGQFGYTSIYPELPAFELKRNKTSSVFSGVSNRPWETIFSGSSHMLPPLTKLCSEFMESLMEKRTSMVE